MRDREGKFVDGGDGEGTRFRKGHEPWNKGVSVYTGGDAGWFKKGHLPANTRSDGEISIRADKRGVEYKHIRVGLGKWEYLQRYNWREKFGEIPKGMILVCRSGDVLNCEPENWELITRGEHAVRNRWKGRIKIKTKTNLTTKALRALRDTKGKLKFNNNMEKQESYSNSPQSTDDGPQENETTEALRAQSDTERIEESRKDLERAIEEHLEQVHAECAKEENAKIGEIRKGYKVCKECKGLFKSKVNSQMYCGSSCRRMHKVGYEKQFRESVVVKKVEVESLPGKTKNRFLKVPQVRQCKTCGVDFTVYMVQENNLAYCNEHSFWRNWVKKSKEKGDSKRGICEICGTGLDNLMKRYCHECQTKKRQDYQNGRYQDKKISLQSTVNSPQVLVPKTEHKTEIVSEEVKVKKVYTRDGFESKKNMGSVCKDCGRGLKNGLQKYCRSCQEERDGRLVHGPRSTDDSLQTKVLVPILSQRRDSCL